MQKITLIPDADGKCKLPEGVAFTPGEALTLYTATNEEDSYFPLYLETNENCRFTDEQFLAFSQANETFHIFRSSTHQIIIEMGTTLQTSKYNSKLNAFLVFWNMKYKLGEIFDSNGLIRLPDDSIYAPDAAFIAFVRWNALNEEERNSTKVPIVPNFVAELMSKSDSLLAAQRKMQEVWMDNGVETGLLIDPEKEKYYVYAQGEEAPQEFSFDVLFSCKTLPHFELNLYDIL